MRILTPFVEKQLRPFLRTGSVLLICLIVSAPVYGHAINFSLEKSPPSEVAWYYFKLGFGHIIPSGYDHLLFIMGICLIGSRLRTIVWQATAFTIAHSITLALSMKNIIIAPPAIVEPVIALSIVFIAAENFLVKEVKVWRVALVFLFGLIHGLGFASSLSEIGLPPGRFYHSILFFNLGVEAGQLAVILLLMFLFVLPFRKKDWYRQRFLYPVSAGIGLVGIYWTIERIFY